MDDYYRRGFGPASAEVKAYWAFLEESRNRKVDDYPGEANGYDEVYNQAFFDKAYGLLDRAAARAADAAAKYQKRIEFVRVGLDHTRLISELRRLSRQMLERGVDAAETAGLVRAKWDEVKRNSDERPHAIHWGPIRPGKRMSRGGLFHPDFMKSAKAKHIATWRRASDRRTSRKTVRLQSAEEAGWELVFSDEFDRKELGGDWTVLEGNWTVEDGALRGSGTLVSSRDFPGGNAVGYLRMEFDAVTDVGAAGFLGKGAAAPRVSDMSAVLHGKLVEEATDFLESGYFFQFGGKWNKTNQIRKAGRTLVADGEPQKRIAPNKVHKIVVESDHGRLSLFVDGRCVLTYRERISIIGDGHNRVGFYFYTAAKVLNVKVHTKRLRSGLDLE